ncbi:DUF2750 domain-containing protein [Bacillus sp. FJAT-47783]|uniref:DUF2750 domain-containing protein n=1 Tax=Bacillus sp. FJAT-47783 TaxID=2922712 RepID=UPI001FAB5AB5|nr:DUF2750 domain-containing protein [Bacillus sp. FJAT-47783]
MNEKEYYAVLNLPAIKRYEYFLKKVVDWEEVWGLYHDGWAMTKDDIGNLLIPFWPKKEFAQYCAKGEWDSYKPEIIELEEFIDEWLPGIKKDGYKPSIFWNNKDSVVIDVDVLLQDLHRELENY